MSNKSLLYPSLLVLFLAACGGTSSSSQTSEDVITLQYAGWNLSTVEANNIERQMIAAYEEANPHISVEIIERPRIVDEEGNEQDVSWDEFFAAQAVVDNLPDVYMTANLPGFTAQGWAEEITEQVAADPTFTDIPEDIRVSAAFGDRYFALPSTIFYFGFFINRTAINRVGPRAVLPTYGMTYQELMEAAEANSKSPIEGGDGIIGISGLESLVNWLPAQMNPDLGWFTFNEADGYHLDGPEFEMAVNEQLKYYGPGKSNYSDYVLDALDPSMYADYFGVSQNVFESGNQSIRWEGSYAMRDWLTRSATEGDPMYGSDIDFIGTPSWTVDGVGEVNRIPVVVDYLGIGKGTDHINEAYDLAKWMGYSAEGYAKRLELAAADPVRCALNFTPLIPNQDLINGFFDLYPNMTEFKKIVEQHDDFILESVGKNVPGYWNSRANALFDVIQIDGVDTNRSIGAAVTDIYTGRLSLADAIQKGLNTIANEQWITAKEQLDAYLEGLA